MKVLIAGTALFLGALAGPAQNLVTFQIDMTAQSPSEVYVRGSFNDWGNSQPSLALTNNGAGIWSGTFDDTNAPGTLEQCKFFYQPGDVWENDPNRQFVLADGGQTLPLTTFSANDWPAPVQNVTFQVDMTAQLKFGFFLPGQPVRVSGSFNGWGDGNDMTNNPAAVNEATNIYTAVVPISGFPGASPQYKFRANGGWENDPNRSFTIAGGDQVLPLVYYNNLSPDVPTNAVTFQVDMSAQILSGGFVPGQLIRVAGSMYSPPWGNGVDLTNNPALPDNGSNIYSTVINVIAEQGTSFAYKFRANGGWESPTSTGGNDRSFQIAGGDQILPLVYYNDASLCDLLLQDTLVTFVLHITNGTPNNNGVPFNKDFDTLHINGPFLGGWQPWDVLLPLMVNDPFGSDFYKYTHLIPAGQLVAQEFKFGINGADNEAPMAANHIQYIRTLGNEYELPAAEFGTNFAATRVEQSFGNLTVSVPDGAYIPVSWLGRPCVTLQVRSDVASGNWVDLPATDSTGFTNWPNIGDAGYFRLQKREFP